MGPRAPERRERSGQPHRPKEVIEPAVARPRARDGRPLHPSHTRPVDAGVVVAVVVGLVLVWGLFIGLLWVLRPRDVGLRELLAVVPDLLRLVRDLLSDRAVPLGVRVALVALLAWLLSPIDLIPEFIPLLGPLDDVVVAVLVLRYVRRRLGEGELRRRWRGSNEGFELLRSVLGSSSPRT